jgi:hypothetical protein
LQDNGVMRGPSTYVPGKSNPDAWKPIYGGDGSAVVIDPKDANLVYAAFQFGYAARLNLKSGERKRIRPRPELTPEKKEPPLRYNWVTPFILSPHSREILYFGANRLYRSFDRGDTWTALSGDLTSNRVQGDVPFGTLTSVAESPKRFGLLYAGTDEGKVWMTPDGGVTWTDVSAGLARDRWVTRVIASEHDENTVYVSQNGYRNDDFAAYLFRSTNRGQTWESIAAGLPAEPINSVREDPKAKHLLYVATDMGVFVSLDKGATWAAMAGNLPNVPVHDLQVHPKQGDLVLATHGRSIYLTEAAPLRKLTPSVMGKTLHAFAVKSLEADPNRGYGDHPWITWPRQDVVVRIPYWSKAGGAASVRIKDEHGSVWQELSATGTPGLNVVSYDLSADPKMADAAEAAARAKTAAAEKQAEKGKARKPAAPKAPAPVTEPDAAEPEEEPTEEEDAAATSSSSGKADVDPELERILADPLRSSRPRYLKPGKYTVEIRVGGTTTTTALTLKPAKDSSDDEEEAER